MSSVTRSHSTVNRSRNRWHVSIVRGSIGSEERLEWLRERLTDDGAVTLAAAADALGVSEMTIRRDLAELEERGLARRVRGGAKAIGPQTFAQRHTVAARAKSRIAAKLASLVPADGVVAFDASSTVMRLAAMLDESRDLTVLTNSPETFGALQGQPCVTPLLTGGQLDPRTGSLVGPLACRSAGQLRVGTFFASAAAVDVATGSFEATLEEAEVKRSIAASADQVVLALDASKLVATSVAVAIEWDRVDVVVTDLPPADQRLDPYRRLTRLI